MYIVYAITSILLLSIRVERQAKNIRILSFTTNYRIQTSHAGEHMFRM